MATVVLDILLNVENIPFTVSLLKKNQNIILSLLCNCREYVFQSATWIELVPSLLHLCTTVTRVFGPQCRQYHLFLLEVLHDLQQEDLNEFSKVCSSRQGAFAMLSLLVDSFSLYSSVFSLHLLLKCASRVEKLSFSHYCVEMAKIMTIGCSEKEKNDWLLRLFGEDLFVEHETNWMSFLNSFDTALKVEVSALTTFEIESFADGTLHSENLNRHRNVIVLYGSEFYHPDNFLSQLNLLSFPDFGYVELESQESLRVSIARTLSCHKPLLLCGASCSGKSATLRHFANVLKVSSERLVHVQITAQFEDRVLTGFYTCGTELGELVWQPGILSQCVSSGKWLLLEDLHKASADVITVVQHFLSNFSKESANTRHQGFQLIATCEPDFSGDLSPVLKPLSIGGSAFSSCCLPKLEDGDIKAIIEGRFKNLLDLTPKLLILKNTLISHSKAFFSVHSFFKFCAKIDRLDQLDAEEVCHFALDFFTAMIADESDRLSVAAELVSIFNYPKENAEFIITQYKPDIKVDKNCLKIGRSQKVLIDPNGRTSFLTGNNFAMTKPALLMLENVLLSVQDCAPVLLCGETGTGKTSLVQFLANHIGVKLTVLNMSHQSNSTDLIGGLKPVTLSRYFLPIKAKFDELFLKTFKKDVNEKFLSHVTNAFVGEKFHLCLKLMLHVSKLVPEESKMLSTWKTFKLELDTVAKFLQSTEKNRERLMFSFVDGCLLEAMKNGHWLLLDEINLAGPETLDCLLEVLEKRSLTVDETAGKESITAHKDFRLFACMNPATDVGKTSLPTCVRNHFMEFYFPQTSDEGDLALFATEYLKSCSKVTEFQLVSIVKLYVELIDMCRSSHLYDSEDKLVSFSLRSFARALKFIHKAKNCSGNKACAEAFKYGFINQLNDSSQRKVKERIEQYFPDADKEKWMKTSPDAICVEGFWLEPVVPLDCTVDAKYVLTETVRGHLSKLAGIVMAGREPVLLQGETSVGKTSLIHYLAELLGQKVWRINNHEHTDIQEYLGAYCASKTGELIFEDGVLVKAMKNGNWVILDELNLAPTEVLEALNRLLDDNRELYIPETNRVVKAHPQFMLFGTQNPAGSYSGRKVLSRAFRNRFIELNFNQIPEDELKVILSKRCDLPNSYATRIIDAMKYLHSQRSLSNLFGGKSSFITLRDLFRWANRYSGAQLTNQNALHDWNLYLAQQGFMLLAGRARNEEDKLCIQTALEKTFKVTLNSKKLFSFSDLGDTLCVPDYLSKLLNKVEQNCNSGIAWTGKMVRMAVLISNALQNREPVLLIGETGCGKTTICQLLAESFGQRLYTVNCNMNSDASDFIGSLRPVRNHESTVDEVDSESTVDSLAASLFQWQDGPVTQAAKSGGMLLLDEISLADDSVLERLNSLFEENRTLLIAENTQDNQIDVVDVHKSFRVVATMNPSGDYGKKELSIALRNRFTEIWCPADITSEEILTVVNQISNNELSQQTVQRCCEFVMHFLVDFGISLRDVKSWIEFIKSSKTKIGEDRVYVEGAWLVFLDSLTPNDVNLKNRCIRYLTDTLGVVSFSTHNHIWQPVFEDFQMKVAGFAIERTKLESSKSANFDFSVPTTNLNMVKIMRALTIKKPILIEGVPGIGKTAIVENIARLIGVELVRINLSEQTDISDLVGNDLPNLNLDTDSSSADKHMFSWHDGPLLAAMNRGQWVLLDEINLASQSVLEGLNALFDHRGEVFISELDKSFKLSSTSTRFFATQNPSETTNGRKSLPRSFLNRFSKIYMDALNESDFRHIFEAVLQDSSEHLKSSLMQLMVKNDDVNLRDVLRFANAVSKFRNESHLKEFVQEEALLKFIIEAKLKSSAADIAMTESFVNCDIASMVNCSSPDRLRIGKFEMSKTGSTSVGTNFTELPNIANPRILESLIGCVSNKFPVIISGNESALKVDVVQQLGVLTGHCVKVVNLNSCTDVLDLFGKYSNFDCNVLIDNGKTCVSDVLKSHLRCSKTPQKVADKIMMALICLETCNTAEMMEKFVSVLSNIQKFSDLSFESEIAGIRKLVEICSNQDNKKLNNFVWENSALMDCVQNGHWLVLQNVDLCSCAVLDRLNSLLEPNGKLTLGELSTNQNGEVLTVSPHEDFRVFLTVSGSSGLNHSNAVSSAMYNRCVVIDMPGSEETDESNSGNQFKSCPFFRGFEVYSLKMHSWFYKVKLFDQILSEADTSFRINNMLLIMEHLNCSSEDPDNQLNQVLALNYLKQHSGTKLLQIAEHERVLRSSKTDILWDVLPLKDLEQTVVTNSVTISAENTVLAIVLLLEDIEKEHSLSSRVKNWSSICESLQQLKAVGMKESCRTEIENRFFASQKALKWINLVLSELQRAELTGKNTQMLTDQMLGFIFTKFESIVLKSTKTSDLNFKQITKLFPVSAALEEVPILKELFSESLKDDRIVSMEIDEIDNLAKRDRKVAVEPSLWLEIISLLTLKQKVLTIAGNDGPITDLKLSENPKLPTILIDLIQQNSLKTRPFDQVFVALLAWAKLWLCESELLQKFEVAAEFMSNFQVFHEPTLENYQEFWKDADQIFGLIWSHGSWLVRNEECDVRQKLVAQFEVFMGSDDCEPKLFQLGCQLFKQSVRMLPRIDPAQETLLKIESNNQYVLLTRNYLDLKRKMYDALLKSDSSRYLEKHPKVNSCKAEITKSEFKSESLKLLSFPREIDPERYNSLVNMITNFDKTIVEVFLKQNGSFGSNFDREKLQALKLSMFALLQQLFALYPDFKDVFYLPVTGICIILIFVENQSWTQSVCETESSIQIFPKRSGSCDWLDLFICESQSTSSFQNLITLFRSFPCYWQSLECGNSKKMKRFVSKLFSKLWKYWRDNEQKLLEEEEANASGYVYKEKKEITVDSIIPEDPNIEEDPVDSDEKRKEPVSKFSENNYFQIWKGHDDLMKMIQSESLSSPTEFNYNLLASFSELTRKSVCGFGQTQSWLQNLLLHTNCFYKKYYSVLETGDKMYNIYTDQNVEQISKCAPLLKDLRKRVLELLEDWPDHPNLCGLEKSIDQMLRSAPISQTVVYMAVSLESALSIADSWEKVAAKHVSLGKQLGPLKQLLIHWRSLELKFWKDSMLYHKNQVYRSVSRYWFNLFACIVQNLNGKTSVAQLIEALFKFLHTSSVGEFEARLDLLRSWAGYCRLFGKHELASVVLNIVDYHTRSLLRMEKAVEAQVDLLKHDLKSFVKIQQWRDFNIFSLKESVLRCKVKIRKVLHSYDALLKQPVTEYLVLKEEPSSTSQEHPPNQSDIRWPKQLGCKIQLSVIPAALQSVYRASLKFARKLSLVQSQNSTLLAVQGQLQADLCEINEHVTECGKECRELEQKLSQAKDEEAKKSLLSTAKFQMQKRRSLFKQLTDFLQQQGLSFKRSLNSNEEVSDLLQVVPVMEDIRSLSSLESSRSISLVIAHQYAAFSHFSKSQSSELDPRVFQTCSGFIKDSFNQICLLWKATRSSVNSLSTLSSLEKCLKEFGGCAAENIFIHRKNSQFREIMDFSMQLLDECVKLSVLFGQVSTRKDVDTLEQVFTSFGMQYETVRLLQKTLRDLLENRCWKDLLELSRSNSLVINVKSLLRTLDSCYEATSRTRTTFSQCQNQIFNPFWSAFSVQLHLCDDKICRLLQKLKQISPTSFNADVEPKILKLSVKAINVAQRANELIRNQSEVSDDSKEGSLLLLRAFLDGLSSCLASCNLEREVLIMRTALDKTFMLHENDVIDLQNCHTSFLLLYTSIVYLEKYLEIVFDQFGNALLAFLQLTKDCNKIFLELMVKGFCVPKEFKDAIQSGESKEAGKFEECGIDEGQGVRDVSDQIESEDQLKMDQKADEDENDGGKEEKSEDKDEGKESNPIEVSEDFLGDLEDLKLDENEQDSDDNGQDNLDEVEDKFGADDDNEGPSEDKQEEINDDFWNDDKEEEEDQSEEKIENDVKRDGKVDTDDKLESKEEEPEDGKKSNEQLTSEEIEDKEGEMRADEDSDDEKQERKDANEEKPEELEVDDLDENKEGEDNETIDDDFEEGKLDDNEAEDEESNDDLGKQKDDENSAEDEEGKEDGTQVDEELEKQKEDECDENADDEVDENVAEEDPTDATKEQTLPSDAVDPPENRQSGAAAAISNDSQAENQEDQSVVLQASASQDKNEETDDSNKESMSNQATSMTYGSDNKGGKRNLNEDEVQVGSKDEQEPVHKKGKVESSNDENVPEPRQRNQIPPEKLLDCTYEHVREHQKHDIQMLDDAREKVDNCFVSEDAEMEDHDETPDNLDENLGEAVDEDKEKEENLNKELAVSAGVVQKQDTEALSDKEADPNEDIDEEDDWQDMGVFDSSVNAPDVNISNVDLESVRNSLENVCGNWSEVVDHLSDVEASALWSKYSALTSTLSRQLSEQIRIILEPLQSGRLKGDYRSGKRLNMKRLIPYIASGYRKDKIWLRRTKPQKRNYQVMLAIDDSSSMNSGRTRSVAFESVATLTTAFALVEVGQIAVAKFGETCELIHDFTKPFTMNSGSNVLRKFAFRQPKTKIVDLMNLSTDYMARHKMISTQPVQDQLLIVISDGRGLFVEGSEKVRRAVEASLTAGIWTIFVILDTGSSSIANISVPVFSQSGSSLVMRKYLDIFPFKHFVVLGDSSKLPETVCRALQQWIQLTSGPE